MWCGDGLFFNAGLTVQVTAVGDASRAATVMFTVTCGMQGLRPLDSQRLILDIKRVL